MPGIGATPSNFAESYQRAMNAAEQMYDDAIHAVAAITGGAYITQLGGMCLAIESIIEGGWLWVTDNEDNLPWDREAHHTGWAAGIRRGDREDGSDEGDVVFLTVADTSLDALHQLVIAALKQFAEL